MPERVTMNVKEMGAMMGISTPKAYDLASSEGFPSIKMGRRIVIPIEAFNRWLDEQTKAPKR